MKQKTKIHALTLIEQILNSVLSFLINFKLLRTENYDIYQFSLALSCFAIISQIPNAYVTQPLIFERYTNQAKISLIFIILPLCFIIMFGTLFYEQKYSFLINIVIFFIIKEILRISAIIRKNLFTLSFITLVSLTMLILIDFISFPTFQIMLCCIINVFLMYIILLYWSSDRTRSSMIDQKNDGSYFKYSSFYCIELLSLNLLWQIPQIIFFINNANDFIILYAIINQVLSVHFVINRILHIQLGKESDDRNHKLFLIIAFFIGFLSTIVLILYTLESQDYIEKILISCISFAYLFMYLSKFYEWKFRRYGNDFGRLVTLHWNFVYSVFISLISYYWIEIFYLYIMLFLIGNYMINYVIFKNLGEKYG